MKLIIDPSNNITVKLSRRNLRSLLAKLDVPGSACTLVLEGDRDAMELDLTVIAEEDEAHYAGRIPGPIHSATLEKMTELDRDLNDPLNPASPLWVEGAENSDPPPYPQWKGDATGFSGDANEEWPVAGV